MQCPACSAINPAGSRYCEGCGAALHVPCPHCGHRGSPAAHYCALCGAELRAAGREGTPARGIAFSEWGELKQATVLFADIASSTEIVASLDPEQAMARLTPAVRTMCDVVERFEGTVVRTLGDGIMALFGAPRAHEGHALLACEAALAMQRAFARGDEGLAIRVGLHSGQVVAEPPITEHHREQGAHGVTIHLASRVPALAQPGGICITGDCHRLVRSYCDVSPLGRHMLKGIALPVEIYALLGLKPAVASEPFRGVSLTSLHGREREFALLQKTLRRTESRDTKVTGIAGAPGTGKSRLCYEFAKWCRARLIPVFEARAQLYGHATPLQPVLEFLRASIFGILPSDAPETARARIAECIAEIGPTLEADLPLLYEFLGVAGDDAAAASINPRVRHARLLDVVRHIVRHRGASTSVIIIEDLHWLDEASEDFVATLVDAVSGTRTMLVLNYRPAYHAAWMQGAHYEQIVLAELTPSEIDALVEELIGPGESLAGIRQRVARRSGGNPFFAEELVRSLADNGVLAGIGGSYTLAATTGEGTLPATVQAVIGARIDRLDDNAKRILQVCGIIGKEIALPVLERVTEVPARAIAGGLERLCEAGLIQPQSGADAPRYAFRHPLIQEVAYTTQLKGRRAALHASVATAMESFYRGELDELAGLVAYHFEAAGQPLDAARYEARAATWVGSTDTAQAIRHWKKVRHLLQGQPRAREDDILRIMASSQIAWLGWRQGLTAEEAKPFIDEALGWAREIDDTMVPLLLFVEGRITVASGGPADTYVERVREALTLAAPKGDIGRTATLHASLSHAYGWAGLLAPALAANDAALEGIAQIGKFDHQFLGYNVEHWTLSLRGRILARLGKTDEAQQCFDRMLGLSRAQLDPTVQIIAHVGCVDIAWFRGDAPSARMHAGRVAEIADSFNSPYLRVFAFASAGTAKGIAGDFAGAARDFTEGLQFLRSTRAAMENEAEMMASLADCHYRAGDCEAAIAAARRALDVARERSARLPECRASITCAGALIAQHGGARLPEAEALLARAEELIRLSGAVIYEPMLAPERSRLRPGATPVPGAPAA